MWEFMLIKYKVHVCILHASATLRKFGVSKHFVLIGCDGSLRSHTTGTKLFLTHVEIVFVHAEYLGLLDEPSIYRYGHGTQGPKGQTRITWRCD